MTRNRTRYQCQHCGAEQSQWAGQCGNCHSWNGLVEVADAPAAGGRRSKSPSPAKRLAELSAEPARRAASGTGELDRVLGGGWVPGAVVLVGGDPGIGKSTLLLQVLAQAGADRKVLYITGEESLQQVKMRGERLGVDAGNVPAVAETDIDAILSLADKERPALMVVDSIQTVYTNDLNAAPGAVSQLRECSARLVRFAKSSDTTLVIVGHVTKEGVIAGPRVLEHMVDTVLYFESESGSRFRVLRAVKNRFGAVNEIGVFAMTETGLREVSNPSAIFLSGHRDDLPGSAVLISMEGTRPLLVELQALVDASALGNPRRVAVGLEQNRLAMLLAVLHRHAGIAMGDQDVFVNAVGGLRVSETGADLPTLLAIVSSFRNRPLPAGLACFGELGLAGEVRPVPGGEERIREAAKQGYRQVLVPRANAPRKAPDGIEIIPIERLSDALDRVSG